MSTIPLCTHRYIGLRNSCWAAISVFLMVIHDCTTSLLVPLGQTQPVPICFSHWDRLCLSHWDKHNLCQSACPTGTGCACPVVFPVGQVWYRHHPSKVGPWPILRPFLIKNRRGPNQISDISYQKSLSNWSKIETKNWYWPRLAQVSPFVLSLPVVSSLQFVVGCL